LQAPVLAACRDQQLSIRDGLALVQLDVLLADVDASRDGVHPLDSVFLIPALGFDEPPRQRLLTAQVGLGKRRAAKRRSRLVADQNNATGITLLTQGLGGDAPGHSRPEDGKRAV